MTDKERKAHLKLIKAALKEFPKVLARKERAYKERQKRLKAFEPLSKMLLALSKKGKE